MELLDCSTQPSGQLFDKANTLSEDKDKNSYFLAKILFLVVAKNKEK